MPEVVESEPLWYKDAIIYEVHVRSFFDKDGNGIGDFKGLIEKLDYLKDLGVNVIWLLPFYPSPLKDDGYDVSAYFDVNLQYGTLHDFRVFLNEAHKRGLRVITELILNHTSDQHLWFQNSRSSINSKYRNFYVWSDTPEKYSDTRVIFRDFEKSNWTLDSATNKYYWHRFYSHQPDLNYDNPAVQKKMIEVVNFWLKMGVDGLRLDAVPYLFEREDTNCENLPETHAYLKKIRAYVDSRFKDKLLLAEANQWPTDAVTYFGEGDECNMAYHFPLMPRIFMSIYLEDQYPIIDILENTPPIPDNCQWALFLRNHDELTLEMVTDEERDYMYRVYAKDKQARINLGIRRRLAPLMGNNRRKIETMNVLLFTLPGTPVIYYGDEIGMGDDVYLGDRNGVRTPMQWSAEINAGFSKANPQKLFLPVIIDPEYNYEAINVENQLKNRSSLFWWMKKIIDVRKHFKAFGRGTMDFIYLENNKILAFIRKYEREIILVVVNLSKNPQVAELDLSAYSGYIPMEILGNTTFPKIGNHKYILTFDPYGYFIFSVVKEIQEKFMPIVTKMEFRLEKSLSEILEGRIMERLELEIFPYYLKSQRWFGGKVREIDRVKIRDFISLESNQSSFEKLLVVDVLYHDGLPEVYVIPIVYSSNSDANQIEGNYPNAVMAKVALGNENGVILDGVYCERFCMDLLGMVTKRRTIKSMNGEVRGSPRDQFRAMIGELPVNLSLQILRAEQNNTSIIYGEKMILKLFRRIEDGVNPDLEITDFLTRVPFPHSPTVLGDIKYHEHGAEETVLATLQLLIKSEGDAWKLCLCELQKYYENAMLQKEKAVELPKSFMLDEKSEIPQQITDLMGIKFIELMKLLGRRTGDLHNALSSDSQNSDFKPEQFSYLYQLALSQSMVSYSKRIFQMAVKSKLTDEAKSELEILIKNQNLITDKFMALKHKKINALKVRIHGDYHLGQVLFTGNDFVIIDFEGEPARALSERRIKQSPLRDVAGMIRSFHYAAYVGLYEKLPTNIEDFQNLQKWAEIWYKCSGKIFLAEYEKTVCNTGIIPNERNAYETLLNAMLVEKAVYELGYELNNRPAWVLIPIHGIRDLIGI